MKLGDLSMFEFIRSMLRSRTDEFALPSWCPNWTPQTIAEPRDLNRKPETHRYAACPGSLYLGRPSPLTITLKGFAVAKVTWCSMNLVAYKQPTTRLITEAVEHLRFCSRHLPSASTGRDLTLTQLVWSALETLVLDPDYKGWAHRGPKINHHELLTHSTKSILARCRPGRKLREILGPVYLASEDSDLYSPANIEIDPRIQTDDYDIMVDMVEDLIYQASSGCRLFMADKVTLGTGLPGLMAGDIVCVLFGGNVPYILRSTGVEGQYLFIGECYVQELMDGQALEMGLPEQKFTLV